MMTLFKDVEKAMKFFNALVFAMFAVISASAFAESRTVTLSVSKMV